MPPQPSEFTPGQQMHRPDWELHYKRDNRLDHVCLHHHDFFEVVFFLSGDVSYTIEGRRHPLSAGQVLLISPQELHQVDVLTDGAAYERYVLWLDPRYLSGLSSSVTDLCRCFSPGTGTCLQLYSEELERMCTLLDRLLEERDSPLPGADLLQASLLTQLLVELNRVASDSDRPAPLSSGTAGVVANVIAYINTHYDRRLTLSDLAEMHFVSKYHLSHEFSRQLGTSVHRYIQKKRLLIARQMLLQGSRPNEVAARCGFGDYAGFYRAFKTEYGISPRVFFSSARSS